MVVLLVAVFSCDKSDFETGESINFGSEGRVYSFKDGLVIVNIPPGAVTNQSYLLYQYSSFDDANLLSHYFINYLYNDINYFECYNNPLLVPATITLPLKPNVTWYSSSGYKVYHVEANPGDSYIETLNDTSKWTVIANFTVDNSNKRISFSTNNLQGIYVFAKEK